MNTEHKSELPAEVREAIETAYINWFSNHMPPRLQDHIASALAPLWPKPTPSAPDVQRVAEGIARVAEDYLEDSLGVGYLVNADGQKAIASILTRFAAELTAQKDAEIARLKLACRVHHDDNGELKVRAEKAEAGAEQYYQNWQSELASNSVRIKQRDDAIAERDQLRAQLAAAQEDTKRLDWLQAHQHWILAAESGEGFSAGRNDSFQNWAQKVESVRAAIDAAAQEDTCHA